MFLGLAGVGCMCILLSWQIGLQFSLARSENDKKKKKGIYILA